MKTTIGQLLVNQALPADLRDYGRVLDKKGAGDLLQLVAERHPEKYRDISKKLMDIGREVGSYSGGYSVGVRDLKPSAAVKKVQLELRKELQQIYANPDLSEEERSKQIILAVGARQQSLAGQVFAEARQTGNPLAQMVVSGARGNENNVNSLLGADLLYLDHRANVIPMPVTRGFAQGLTPAQYFANAFGARKSLFDLQSATSDAGYLNKQLTQAAHRLVVSGVDDDETPYDEAQPRGLPVDTGDADNIGSLLSQPTGGYSRNTVLTAKVLRDLRDRGHDTILVRSPLVGGPRDGGVYARDVGVRERAGSLAPVGDFVGISGAQAISEPIVQGNISSKHSGGVVGAGSGAIGGFKTIDALIQAPKTFPGWATQATLDGRVDTIRAAPQGGHYVTVSGKEFYVRHGSDLKVKPGDTVEAGDVLSDGIPNPAVAVEYKGLGEGRRYFMESFRQVMRDSSLPAHRRNIELLGRGLINHVRMTGEYGSYIPDDIVPYHTLERDWEPREDAQTGEPRVMVGKYLERPVLHHTIGTKIRPSMLKSFEKFGVKAVTAHSEPPPFVPEHVRGIAQTANDPDWMTRLVGSYQKNSLLDAVHRGSTSDELGTSFVPALARGENFGRVGKTVGWSPADVKPATPDRQL
jgi:DNA-directed RNA polymerase subunit beta'